jgi:hypothetical protein
VIIVEGDHADRQFGRQQGAKYNRIVSSDGRLAPPPETRLNDSASGKA